MRHPRFAMREARRSINFRLRFAGTRQLLIVLALLLSTVPRSSAQERIVSPVNDATDCTVKIHRFGNDTAAGEQFVIVHGQGGLTPDDRFCELAAAIRERFPESAVFLVDWTRLSITRIESVALPWCVARQIDAVAEQSVPLLRNAGLDPARTTLIGESFGVYVNAQLAKHLGGVHRTLAFNPANEIAGYWPPDLKTHATQAWSFHTWSIYDSVRSIAHAEFFLETPVGATNRQQHVAGIPWLTTRLIAADSSWLLMEKPLAFPQDGMFPATARMDGVLSVEPVARRPAKPSVLATADLNP